MFETKLIPSLLIHLPIEDILRTCSSLTQSEYRNICRNQEMWRTLLLRDYGMFEPIIQRAGRDSYINLYRQFYRNPLFNLPEFRRAYEIVRRHVTVPVFINEEGYAAIIPRAQPEVVREPGVTYRVEFNVPSQLYSTINKEAGELPGNILFIPVDMSPTFDPSSW